MIGKRAFAVATAALVLTFLGPACSGQTNGELAPECTSQLCPLPKGLTISVSSVERGAAPATRLEALPHDEFYLRMQIRLHVSRTYQTASGFIVVTPAAVTPAIDSAQIGYSGTFPHPSTCSIPRPPPHEPAASRVGPLPVLSRGETLGPISVCVIVKGDPTTPLRLTWWITLLHKYPPYPDEIDPYQTSLPLP